MFFAMAVSPDHLLAATVVASVAKEYGKLEALVDLSQMTVSQMTATSTAESHQQRLHWLAEQVLNWSGLPVVHIRPTVFLDTPMFTTMVAQSIQDNGTIALPFGSGRTSPVAVDDVARVVATVLRDPAAHIGHVHELTGPESVNMTELAAAFSRALNRPVSYVDVPLDQWLAGLSKMGLPPHAEQHVATMARLHRDNRYDRTADGVERVTGIPPQSIEAFVAARRDFYLEPVTKRLQGEAPAADQRHFATFEDLSVRVALEGGGSGANAVDVRRTGDAELFREFAGIEEIRPIALIQHLVGFSDKRIEPSGYPEHRPAQHAMARYYAEFLRSQRDEFFPCQRIGCGGDMPRLIPGVWPPGQLYQALRGVRRVGKRVRNGIIHEP
jgi:uncharacterized protein YbjT (DUF2867 family)